MTKLFAYTTLIVTGMIVPGLRASDCSNADLRGAYSFVASGTFGGVPFAVAGQTTYEGNGNASGWVQINYNGTILPALTPGAAAAPGSWTATYSVDPSTCMATKIITLSSSPTFGPLAGAKLYFFITAGSDFRELRFLLTNTSLGGMPAGTAITGTARKQ